MNAPITLDNFLFENQERINYTCHLLYRAIFGGGRGRRGRVRGQQSFIPMFGSTAYTLHSLSKILLYLYGAIVFGASAGVPFICALIRVGNLILSIGFSLIDYPA
jgi:hypothetical protein